jgi:cob(I)alamin adenosyltransferase
LDELSSLLGHANAIPEINTIFKEKEISMIQQMIQDMNAHLAYDPNSTKKMPGEKLCVKSQVDLFEKWIDIHWKQMPPLNVFILPSGNELTTRYQRKFFILDCILLELFAEEPSGELWI